MDLNQTKPKRRTRSKTDEKTLRGRSVWIDETGEITGKKGTKYSEVSTTIPFGTGWITAPTIDKSGNKLSDEEVKQRLKDNQGKDFITGEKLPVFSSEEKASEYAQWRSNTMFDKEAIKEGFPEETFPGLPEDKKEEDKEGQTSLKGFIEYLFTPSRHFGTGQYNEGGVAEQMEMFGYTAEGAQQEADKFVEEAGDLETDISKAASFIVPFYDSGVNIANVAQEYLKPEQERDYDYIKSQFTEAGQSAAIEAGLLLMGGVAGKYGAKGIKALADKVKQYEIDPTAMSAFGAGAISKKPFKKTRKAYKLFIQRDGKLYPLFVNAADEVPMGEFLEADLPKTMFTAPNGRNYVPSKGGKRSKGEKSRGTGVEIPIPDEKTRQLLIKEGFITEKKGRGGVGFGKILAVAARPGWHASQAPVATHIGVFRDMPVSKKEVNKLLEAGITPEAIVKYRGKFYVKRREDDLVFAEVEMADDVDYQSMLKSEGKTDINDRVPKGGSYRYEDGQADSDKWVVGGDMRVKRILSREETKATQKELGVKDLPYRDEVESILGKKFNKGGLAGDIMYTGDEDYKVTSSYGEDEMQMNKGGAVDGQMQMAFMNEGGIADDGMDVDPVSGNEVPPGSLAEEVRDDIPAQLSEGEYVVPADVVRYYGVKFFEDLRDQAKMGLADMEANGRIGGEPVPEGGPKNENLTPEEQQAVEAMMGMQQGGAVQNPYLQQQQLYNQEPPKAVGNTMGYATGGSPAPVNQLQTQAITPTVYNQPNYSFLSPSTTTQTSQTTEQAINQATQNVFSPVMMRSPEGVEAEAKTREQMKEWLAAGWVIITAAETTTTPTETTTTPTDTTTTPTTTPRTGGGGTNITVGGKTGTGGFGFKNWGEDVDWSDPDSIKTFVENSTQGLLDPKTGKKITEIGFGIAGPVGGALGAAASTVPSLSSLSDLRASRFILQAQGMETDFVDAQIKKITDNASGFTNFIDKVFGEVADGDAKGRAALDRLGLEYTRDEKTGDPTFTPEQIAANKAKAKRPATSGDADPVTTTSKGPTGIAGERIVSTPTKPEPASSPQEAQAAARKRRKDRRDKQRQRGALMKKRRDTAVKKAKSISKSVKGKGAKAVDSRKKSGAFDKGGLMKKGNK